MVAFIIDFESKKYGSTVYLCEDNIPESFLVLLKGLMDGKSNNDKHQVNFLRTCLNEKMEQSILEKTYSKKWYNKHDIIANLEKIRSIFKEIPDYQFHRNKQIPCTFYIFNFRNEKPTEFEHIKI
jgi:hypothetical protein